MKILIIGAGMYVTGRDNTGVGTILSSIAESSKNINIENISVFKLHHFIERSRFLCFCLYSFDKIEP